MNANMTYRLQFFSGGFMFTVTIYSKSRRIFHMASKYEIGF